MADLRERRSAMKSVARLLATFTIALVPLTASAQSVALRVACFSPQRAFSESVDGKAVLARLTTLQNEKSRAIDDKNKVLKAQEQALQETGPLLTEAVRTQRASDVEKFRIDIQRMIEDARAELMGIQRDAESAFVVKLKPALDKVAKERGLQIVFNVDAGPVAWFDPSMDITSDVVRQLTAR
jgi:Skp family chaperone for outer membrane proteins